jgi:hypothetical protein
MNEKTLARSAGLLVAGALLVSGHANAVLDITAATSGITDATVAVVAVLGAMITMGAAFFGLKKIKRLIGG